VIADDGGPVGPVAELLAAATADEEIEKMAGGPSPQDLHRPAASGIDGDEHGRVTPFVTVHPSLGGQAAVWWG
jgi:hypothetical protein